MNKHEVIDFALLETAKAHPTWEIHYAIYSNMLKKEVDYTNFTSKNGARKEMERLKIIPKDLVHFIIEETIRIYNGMVHFYNTNDVLVKTSSLEKKYRAFLNIFPEYETIRKAIDIIAKKEINAETYFLANTNELFALTLAITKTRYRSLDSIRRYIDGYGKTATLINHGEYVDLFKKVHEDFQKNEIATNLRVNRRATNKCLLDVMSGAQMKNQHNEYGLDGTLYASQDVGKKRTNQEDSTIILTHPANPEFKFLAVADGMGGVEHGEIASKYTIQELSKWFKELDEELFYNPRQVQNLLNDKIQEISRILYQKYNTSYKGIVTGSTFVGAVVCNDQTVITHVGDSRAYATRNEELYLLTRDQSLAWPYEYQKPESVPKEVLDSIRFRRNGNQILASIGWDVMNSKPNSRIINNNAYDRLLLFSDGVTDLLDQETIRIISTSTPKENITRLLVETALSNSAIRKEGADELNYGIIQAGKDNATATMYARR